VLQFLYTGDYTLEIDRKASYHGDEDKEIDFNQPQEETSQEEIHLMGAEERFAENPLAPPEFPEDEVEISPDSEVLNEARVSTACHFHVLMYVQADYFQIDSLQTRAEKYFRASFLDWRDRRSFKATITEIYTSTPESDQRIRNAVVALTINNLATLRSGIEAILDDEFLKRLPAFAADLSISMLNQYCGYETQF
jgi:hypothetical protein